ncbi:D-3-phosphoglycerate dehydrogenase (EC [Olavius sp. associated proteobacterium Delta 1]|nr:D-3-phosphoglycerate dehydrogenase (EC [Olavius sp. associated proteobacterium Delta 1]
MIRLTVYFEPPDDFIARLSNISDNIKINVCTNRDDLKFCLPQTEVLVTLFFWPDAEMIGLAPNLKWIQALTAGVDLFPLGEIKKQGILLTCGRGIHKIYIAEYAIAAMINLARNFHLMFNNQLKAKWDRSVPQDEIHGRVAGIIGLGSIGQEIARKASVLGMRVIGVKNSPQPLEWVDHVYGPAEMKKVFKQSDYVINLLPGTPTTRGLIDKELFSSMRSSACFINLGRGSTVNQADLIDALQTKTIRALVSDVYQKEPLPEDSPLWHLDNVILTPHIAGVSPQYLDRALEIIRHNLQVYVSRSGEMINVVDQTLGY